MNLKAMLEKMKLVELEEVDSSAQKTGKPEPPATRPAAASALKNVPPPPKFDNQESTAKIQNAPGANALSSMTDIPDFDSIYQTAGVKPAAHGFTAFKVLEMLSSPDFAALDPRAKAAALSGFLKMNPSGPIPISDVLEDAVKRDQALDAFEEFLRARLDKKKEAVDQENKRLQKEIDDLTARNRAKMEENARATEGEQEKVAAWQARKRIEERRLFDAISPFVESNPVTLTPPASKS